MLIKGNTKSFFAYVWGKTKARVLTGPLEDSNKNVIDDSKDISVPHFFCERIVNIWNRLPVDSTDFGSLHRFRNSLNATDDKILVDAQ